MLASIPVGRTLYNLVGKNPKTTRDLKIHHDEFDEKIWEEYFVFTFLRNPKIDYFHNILQIFCITNFEYSVKHIKELFYNNILLKNNPTNDDIIDIADYYGEWIHFPAQKEFLKGQYSNGIDKRPYIDFYGKYETLQEDFDYVCEKIGLPKTKLPHSNKSRNDRNFKYERKLLK